MNEFEFLLGREHDAFILQTVARTDLHDGGPWAFSGANGF
jgi:hypothetical protein